MQLEAGALKPHKELLSALINRVRMREHTPVLCLLSRRAEPGAEARDEDTSKWGGVE